MSSRCITLLSPRSEADLVPSSLSLPLAYFLAFYLEWGLVGLWTAQVAALMFVSGAELVVYFFPMKWEKEVDRAEERGEESL